ncbi:hypothetical protein BDQ17DRAFT_1344806 [Cyathus striatus]|nr:hypothetical protein BDQ17DRAFT_1344806 [Cyathus striatus]
MFLANSVERPLKISFTRDRYLWQPQYDPVCSGTWPITLALFLNSARWQTLVMDVMIFTQILSYKFLPTTSAALLESITLTAPIHLAQTKLYHPAKDRLICGAWESAPVLGSFSVIGLETVTCANSWTTHFRPPLSQITTLVLQWHLDVLSCLRTLRECRALLNCTLHVVEIPPDRETLLTGEEMLKEHSVHAYLPNLDEFILLGTVNDLGNDAVFLLLDYVTTPVLQYLTIGNQHRWRRRIFVDFLKRSLCPMVGLRLLNVSIPEDHLLSCLENIDEFLSILHVTSNRIDGLDMSFSENIIRRVSYDPAVPALPLCPSLERLELNANVLNARDGLLAKMVKSRWTPPEDDSCMFTRIRIVGLSVRSFSNHRLDITHLVDLREKGLEFILDKDCPSVSLNKRRHFERKRTKLKDGFTNE